MGPLETGRRVARPADGGTPPLSEPRTGSSVGLWLGILTGLVAGPAVVAGIHHMDAALSLPVRNTLLGSLVGVLFTPVLVVGSFLSVILLPFSLEGLIGEGLWSRVAQALHERRLRPLAFPFFFFVAFPMAVLAFGGSRMKPTDPSLVVPAALGAALLGAMLGGLFGALAGRRRRRT